MRYRFNALKQLEIAHRLRLLRRVLYADGERKERPRNEQAQEHKPPKGVAKPRGKLFAERRAGGDDSKDEDARGYYPNDDVHDLYLFILCA